MHRRNGNIKFSPLALVMLVVGVILGYAWAWAQNQHRLELCNEYGLYCEEERDVSR